MATVVFTGRGSTPGGTHWERAQWEDWAHRHGYSVEGKVRYGTTLLVASRTDTTKAAAARKLGVRVIDYAGFYHLCVDGKPAAPVASVTPEEALERLAKPTKRPQPAVKRAPEPAPEPEPVRSEIEEMPNWGKWG